VCCLLPAAPPWWHHLRGCGCFRHRSPGALPRYRPSIHLWRPQTCAQASLYQPVAGLWQACAQTCTNLCTNLFTNLWQAEDQAQLEDGMRRLARERRVLEQQVRSVCCATRALLAGRGTGSQSILEHGRRVGSWPCAPEILSCGVTHTQGPRPLAIHVFVRCSCHAVHQLQHAPAVPGPSGRSPGLRGPHVHVQQHNTLP
jgi:hypothetical protein